MASMAPTQRPDVSVLEYDRLKSAIEARIRQRHRELTVDEIAAAANASEAKAQVVPEYFTEKYGHFNRPIEGTYRLTLPEE